MNAGAAPGASRRGDNGPCCCCCSKCASPWCTATVEVAALNSAPASTGARSATAASCLGTWEHLEYRSSRLRLAARSATSGSGLMLMMGKRSIDDELQNAAIGPSHGWTVSEWSAPGSGDAPEQVRLEGHTGGRCGRQLFCRTNIAVQPCCKFVYVGRMYELRPLSLAVLSSAVAGGAAFPAMITPGLLRRHKASRVLDLLNPKCGRMKASMPLSGGR